VRSVLVCVRTTLAAQAVTNAATQLGLGDVITTAVNGPEALARVAAVPADILLVDTASVRPDTVAFTRRVLERAPEAAVVFFGPEDSTIARGAVAAGARGLIRGGEREDLVASVAKALMLLLRANRSPLPAAAIPNGAGVASGNGSGPSPNGASPNGSGPQPVPLQRSQVGPDEEDGDVGAGEPDLRPLGRSEAGPTSPGGPIGSVGAVGVVGPGAVGPGVVGLSGARRLALTERELQVLRGMADGKSNAEIGRELFVSEDTVKTHARRLFRKLGARDRAHAVAAAFRAGLVR
jgi:DNA-binding NarL/FixJ family response regulator